MMKSHLNMRRAETILARATLAFLVIYVPAETYVSWSATYGLLNPFYIVDAIAMMLLFVGAAHSLRARPQCSPGLLCAAYGWASANGWRATWDRAFELMEGGTIDYGAAELYVVGCATACSLGCFALALVMVARVDRHRSSAITPGSA